MFQKSAALALALALAAPGLLFAATPVNVNKADAATIAQSLDGIGLAKAQAIVDWREENGPFKSANDLAQIKGIGPATLERNRDAILLTGSTANADTPSRSSRKSKAAVED